MPLKSKDTVWDAHLIIQEGSFMRKRFIEFREKVGSLRTLTLTIQDDTGGVIDMTSTTTYNGGTWKCWRTDGSIVFSGTIVYADRSSGVVSYTLVADDTLSWKSGVWEGEVELLDDQGAIVEQSDTFTFIIEDSY